MNKLDSHYDVIIIGAGPAGSLAASLLVQKQFKVLVIEKQQFPRFSIGESLLPQSMEYLAAANMLDPIKAAALELGFQFKDGAAFYAKQRYSEFDFADKFSSGPSSTFQVKRASFDLLLAEIAQQQGADIRFGLQVTKVDLSDPASVTVQNEQGQGTKLHTDFILDASGFAKVLPKLLDLAQPGNFPIRSSVFCHIRDRISCPEYDRNKILIETHPQHNDIWYWLIPFSDGTASVGCVAEPEFFAQFDTTDGDSLLAPAIAQTERLQALLSDSESITPAQQITAYSSSVKQLHGHRFALLGNAGEFLDPIFSSGVTIAFKSAKLASDLLIKQRQGQVISWQTEFAEPLQQGVETFKAFVESWYEGKFQDIVHYQAAPSNVRQMICSVLAGYAWDLDNPFVKHSKRRLNALAQLCVS